VSHLTCQKETARFFEDSLFTHEPGTAVLLLLGTLAPFGPVYPTNDVEGTLVTSVT
jgi:hypothetical protein